MHLSPRDLSDFSNVTASEEDHEIRDDSRRDNHLAEEISWVYYLRSCITVDRYVASDYQVLYNLVLHLAPSQADPWEIA